MDMEGMFVLKGTAAEIGISLERYKQIENLIKTSNEDFIGSSTLEKRKEIYFSYLTAKNSRANEEKFHHSSSYAIFKEAYAQAACIVVTKAGAAAIALGLIALGAGTMMVAWSYGLAVIAARSGMTVANVTKFLGWLGIYGGGWTLTQAANRVWSEYWSIPYEGKQYCF